MDQAHAQIADSGAVQRLVEECVFAIQNRLFQGTFHDIVIDRCACLPGASASASDSVNTRSLCPARNSAPSCAPPTAPPSIHAALSFAARYVPGESAAVVPATLPAL